MIWHFLHGTPSKIQRQATLRPPHFLPLPLLPSLPPSPSSSLPSSSSLSLIVLRRKSLSELNWKPISAWIFFPVGKSNCHEQGNILERSHWHIFVSFHNTRFIRGDLPNMPVESHATYTQRGGTYCHMSRASILHEALITGDTCRWRGRQRYKARQL